MGEAREQGQSRRSYSGRSLSVGGHGMNEVHILDIKLIGAGIVFIAFALIVVLGYALGPYLEVVSPHDGKLLIIASSISLAAMLITAGAMVYSVLKHKE
jgi:hypothetical protein